VPRTRFAPVKTCADLFVLRSDAYVITEDATVVPRGEKVRCGEGSSPAGVGLGTKSGDGVRGLLLRCVSSPDTYTRHH
jgi:hypothetical protein